MTEIEKLQNNMAIIRKAAGWTCEKFGSFLGLTKQSICNLEHKTVRMTKAQYIAIRTILDYEMKSNDNLYAIMHALINADIIPNDDWMNRIMNK